MGFQTVRMRRKPQSTKRLLQPKKVCDERLDGQYKIEVVDIIKNPALAFSNNIMACPTVIKESPTPKRAVIGDLSKTEVVLAKLEFPSVPLVPDFSKRVRSVSFMDTCSHFKELFGSMRETNFLPYHNYK